MTSGLTRSRPGVATRGVAIVIALAWAGTTRGQAPEPPVGTPIGQPVLGLMAPAASLPGEVLDEVNATSVRPAPAPTFEKPAPVAEAPIGEKVEMEPLDVIRESLFGPADKEDWKPLTLGTFFSEGWDTPYTNAPVGTNGAPKQNWIGAPGGVFGRFFTLDTYYTNHLNNVPGLFLTANAPFLPVHTFTTGNQYAGYGTILLPLNSRFEILVGTAFLDSRKSSPAGGYVGNWGDTSVQARFHLIDQRDFSVVALIDDRIPTGKAVNGSGINYVTPGLEFWWNFAPQWVARGGSSINILTGRKSATSVYVNQLSVGRYLTTKDARIFRELEVHLTATALSDISGGAGHVNDIYLFPGLRFGLDKAEKWSVLGGVQVPVSGPQAYTWQPQLSLTRNY